MQKINKNFSIIIFFILTLLLLALFHYIFFDREATQSSINSVVKLTAINSTVYNVAWHEERIRQNKRLIYSPYPEMSTADRLTFVYGERYVK